MNASGDLGDFSEFTISSANEDDITEERASPVTDNDLSQMTTFHSKPGQTENAIILNSKLNSKHFELEKQRNESYQKEEELQDRIDILLHQRDALQLQLETEIKSNHEANLTIQQSFRRQIEEAEKRQRLLEDKNSRLVQSAIDIKSVLTGDLCIDEEKYEQLKLLSEFELTTRELIEIRIHEIVRPIIQEIRQLKLLNVDLNCEKNELLLEKDIIRQSFDKERSLHSELQGEFKKTLLELSSTKDKVQQGNYKVENFDRILRELDQLKELHGKTKHDSDRLELQLKSLELERDNLWKENKDFLQSQRILELDKNHLSKQLNETNVRCNNAEDRLHNAWMQLEQTKQSREELYDKYVGSREEFRLQYEKKLTEELDNLRVKTDLEIERIKTSTQSLNERELKNMQEQRDLATNDRDSLVRQLKELQEQVDRQRTEQIIQRSSLESQISEMMNEVKVKSFELERTNLLYEESCQKLSQSLLDSEKYQAKFDLISKEYYKLESTNAKQILEMSIELEDNRKKLHSYQQLEKELDLAVEQTAVNQLDDSSGEEGLPYRLPRWINHSQGRINQCIELTRRVLMLERMLHEKSTKLTQLQTQYEALKEEDAKTQALLAEASQPYQYLIESIRRRDATLEQTRAELESVCSRLNQSRLDKSRLVKEKNELLRDLETLANHREELHKLRNEVTYKPGTNTPATCWDRQVNNTIDHQTKPTRTLDPYVSTVPEYSISRT